MQQETNVNEFKYCSLNADLSAWHVDPEKIRSKINI